MPFPEATTSLKGCTRRHETVALCVSCSANNFPRVEVTEGTESIRRCSSRKVHTQDDPNHICKPNTDRDCDVGSENGDSVACPNVTGDNQQMNQSPEGRTQPTDCPVDWPEKPHEPFLGYQEDDEENKKRGQ